MASKYAANTSHLFLRLGDTTLGSYNLWDCHYGAALVAPLQKEIDRRGNRRYYDDVIQPLQQAVANMVYRPSAIGCCSQTLPEIPPHLFLLARQLCGTASEG